MLLILIRSLTQKKLKLATNKRKKRRLLIKVDNQWIGTQNDDDDDKVLTRRPPRLFATTRVFSEDEREGGRANNKLRAQKHAIKTERKTRVFSRRLRWHREVRRRRELEMHGTIDSIGKLCASLNSGKITADVEVICAPPMVYIDGVQSKLKAPYQIAAQNCWVSKGGAFTGEVSAEMLKDATFRGSFWDTRREDLYDETNEFVMKTKYALDTR